MSDQRLQKILSEWQVWYISPPVKPQLVRELSKGRSHQSWLVRAEKLNYVIKLDNTNSRSLAHPLSQELAIQKVVAAYDLSPNVIYSGDDFSVSAFIVSKNTSIDFKDWISVGVELKKIHSLKVEVPKIDLYQHSENYWYKLSVTPKALEALRHVMWALLSQLELTRVQWGLCHHDLNRENLIFSQAGPVFIDWEYAAINHPYFDLATLKLHLTSEEYSFVLQGYTGLPEQVYSSNEKLDLALLTKYCCVVCYLEALWWAVTDVDAEEYQMSLAKLQEYIKFIPAVGR
jgi:fructosamine-3-kinase